MLDFRVSFFGISNWISMDCLVRGHKSYRVWVRISLWSSGALGWFPCTQNWYFFLCIPTKRFIYLYININNTAICFRLLLNKTPSHLFNSELMKQGGSCFATTIKLYIYNPYQLVSHFFQDLRSFIWSSHLAQTLVSASEILT